jgi:hypothetical protein
MNFDKSPTLLPTVNFHLCAANENGLDIYGKIIYKNFMPERKIKREICQQVM